MEEGTGSSTYDLLSGSDWFELVYLTAAHRAQEQALRHDFACDPLELQARLVRLALVSPQLGDGAIRPLASELKGVMALFRRANDTARPAFEQVALEPMLNEQLADVVARSIGRCASYARERCGSVATAVFLSNLLKARFRVTTDVRRLLDALESPFESREDLLTPLVADALRRSPIPRVYAKGRGFARLFPS